MAQKRTVKMESKHFPQLTLWYWTYAGDEICEIVTRINWSNGSYTHFDRLANANTQKKSHWNCHEVFIKLSKQIKFIDIIRLVLRSSSFRYSHLDFLYVYLPFLMDTVKGRQWDVGVASNKNNSVAHK